MSKVFVDEKLAWVVQAKAELDAVEISCYIKNEFAATTAGEVPFFETWPELWVHKAADFNRAKEIIGLWQADIKAAENITYQPWHCKQCGEMNEGNFALCWSCGAMLPSEQETQLKD